MTKTPAQINATAPQPGRRVREISPLLQQALEPVAHQRVVLHHQYRCGQGEIGGEHLGGHGVRSYSKCCNYSASPGPCPSLKMVNFSAMTVSRPPHGSGQHGAIR